MLCRFPNFSHNTMFVGLLFYIPARAHRHKGRKLHFQEAQRPRHFGCCLFVPLLHKFILIYILLFLIFILLFQRPNSPSHLRPQESTKSPRFKFFPFFSRNTLFVGLLFYILARAHRHKGRKGHFQAFGSW